MKTPKLPRTNSKLQKHIPTDSRRHTAQIGEPQKEVMNAFGYKIVFTPSAPFKYRGWLFIESLEMGIDGCGNDKIVVAQKLAGRANELKITVPIRRKLFARLESWVSRNFAEKREGYEALNAIQRDWRNASTKDLREICKLVESRAIETCFWCHGKNITDDYGYEIFCAFCGREPQAEAA